MSIADIAAFENNPPPFQIYKDVVPPKGQGGAGGYGEYGKPNVVQPKAKSDGSSTSYYKIPEGATDIIDLIEFKNMNFSIGNIFKACFRLGQKEGNDDAYDLRKIIFFAQRELARIGKAT